MRPSSTHLIIKLDCFDDLALEDVNLTGLMEFRLRSPKFAFYKLALILLEQRVINL